VVDSVTPTTVKEGDDVTISGKSFGTFTGASRVTFTGLSQVALDNEPPALFKSWQDDRIVCVVPDINVPQGGDSVEVKVSNFFTSGSQLITVLPRGVTPTGSFGVQLDDVSPDPITAGRDNDFKYTLKSSTNVQIATISATLTGQSWPIAILNDQKQPLANSQIPIAPNASKTFFIRVAIPSGTNQSVFKLTASAAATGVQTGSTGALDFAVGQFADPDTTFDLVATTSSPPNALSGSTVNAKAGDITEVFLEAGFTAPGKYELTVARVPSSATGWSVAIDNPAPDANGKHFIEISQQQIDGDADHRVSRTIQVNLAPDSATSPSMQLRLVVKRQNATKSRTFTFDVNAKP
jgi:hypothetical protein